MSNFVYRGKRILQVGFLGLGKSNIAVMHYLSKRFPDIVFTVRCEKPTVLSDYKIGHYRFGNDALSDIFEDVLFLSPSARRDIKEISDAEKRGVILSSDAEFFFEHTKADIYAITGSDGKSTTTHLSSLLISSAGKQCIPIGNIGIALTSCLENSDDISYVTELSSFQLMYIKPKSLRCAITNISKNHLNWHTCFDEYIDAKRNILENAESRIINYDCEITRQIGRDYPLFGVFSALHTEKELKADINAELYITKRENFICINGCDFLDTRAIKIGGGHNILNFMAAMGLGYGSYRKEDAERIAESFSGLSHRCENIGTYGGVTYYDSSIDSSPMRTAATLAAMNKRVIIILGGRSKGLDFSILAPILKEKAKHIVITGECADEIETVLASDKEFKESGIVYTRKHCFADAVKHAVCTAENGDAVLLSPAATSYDEFPNFEVRGDTFKRIIKDIFSEV